MSPLIPVTSTVERAIGSRRYTIAAWTEDGEADSSGNRMSGQELAVQAEVLGHRRTPTVERVRLGEVARLPRALLGNVVEVVEVLREAPPGVADVIEEVRADHVTAESPSRLAARLLHLRGAHRDLVHGADLERPVVEARSLRHEEREVVVVRGAAQEDDHLARPVGELHPEHARVEVELAVEPTGEEEHVPEPAGLRPEACVGTAASDLARDAAGAVERERRVRGRHDARLVADVDEIGVGVPDPEAALRRTARRVDLADARAPHGLARRRVLVPRRAEREMVEALLRPAVEEDRLALQWSRSETHRAVPARRVEQPEIRVELLPGALVGHLERVVEQRLDRHVAYLLARS